MSRMKASVFPGASRNISNVGVVISAAGSFAAAGTASINAKATSDKPRNIGFSHPILRVLTLRIVPLHPPGDKRESGSQVRQSGKFRAARTRRDYPLFADPAPYRPFRASWACVTRDRQDLSRCRARRSEEHTSELQSLMRISFDVFCLKKKNKKRTK